MAEPINLNRARKAKARTDKQARAAENRVRFGRTKAEKTLEEARAEKARRDIDAGKRER
jgi:hypothetical protein